MPDSLACDYFRRTRGDGSIRRVLGVGGLYVITPRSMPALLRGNTNIPTIMVAEKLAAEMVTNTSFAS